MKMMLGESTYLLWSSSVTESMPLQHDLYNDITRKEKSNLFGKNIGADYK